MMEITTLVTDAAPLVLLKVDGDVLLLDPLALAFVWNWERKD